MKVGHRQAFIAQNPAASRLAGFCFWGRPGARTSPVPVPAGDGHLQTSLLLTVMPAACVVPVRGQTPAVESCLGSTSAYRSDKQVPMRAHPPYLAGCLSPQGDGHLQTSQLLTVCLQRVSVPVRGLTPAVESCLGSTSAYRSDKQVPMRAHPPYLAGCLSPQGTGTANPLASSARFAVASIGCPRRGNARPKRCPDEVTAMRIRCRWPGRAVHFQAPCPRTAAILPRRASRRQYGVNRRQQR